MIKETVVEAAEDLAKGQFLEDAVEERPLAGQLAATQLFDEDELDDAAVALALPVASLSASDEGTRELLVDTGPAEEEPTERSHSQEDEGFSSNAVKASRTMELGVI